MTLRPLRPDERPWVTDTWLRSWGQSSNAARALVWSLLDSVTVADDDGLPLGWVAAVDGCLWYVYVRYPARRTGIGMALLRSVGAVDRIGIITRAGRALVTAALGRVPPLRPWGAARRAA